MLRINTGGGSGSAPNAQSVIPPAKAALVRRAGFNPADFTSEFYQQNIGAIRGALVVAAATKSNVLTEVEVRLLLGGKDTATSEGFDSAIRRIEAGVGILPRAFQDSLEGGKLMRVHSLDLSERAWLGSLERVSVEDVVAKANAGFRFWLSDEGDVSDFLQEVQDNAEQGTPKAVFEAVAAAVWTPQRVFLRNVQEIGVTPEILARLLENARVSENDPAVVVATFGYAEVEFNLHTGQVGKHKLLQHIACMGELLDMPTAVALLGMSLVGVTSQGTMEALLRAVPSCVEEPDTGYGVRMPDSRAEAKLTNKVGHLNIREVSQTLTTCRLNDSRTPTEVVAIGRKFHEGGVPVAFESQMGYAVIGEGAEAMLVGYNDQHSLMWTDASKEAKLFTRPKLGGQVVAETVDSHGNSTLTASGLQVRLRSGRVVRDYGTRFSTWITNSVLDPGSGVALSLPGIVEGIRLLKTVSNDIPAIYVPDVDGFEGSTPAEKLEAAVKAGLEVASGTVYHGQPVFSFDGIPYGVFEGVGMEATVCGAPVITPSPAADSAHVAVKVEVTALGDAVKLTCDGGKMTNLAYPVDCTVDGVTVSQPEILLGKETIKGSHVILLRAWGDDTVQDLDAALAKGFVTPEQRAFGGVTINPNQELTADELRAFQTWRDANSFTAEIRVRVNAKTRHILSSLVEKARQDASFAEERGIDPDAFRFYPDGSVSQTVEVVSASLVLGVEISTVPENVGKAKVTGEQLMALNLIDPDLGNRLWKGSAERRNGVYLMIRMARMITAGTQGIPAQPQPNFDWDRSKLRGRDLIEYFSRKYPNGLTIRGASGNPLAVIQFKALLTFSALLPGDGATGIALSVLRVLEHLHARWIGPQGEVPSGWEQMLYRLVSDLQSQVKPWATTSKATLSAVTGTGKVFYSRKVKTTFSPTVEEGLVGIHPDDPQLADLIKGTDINPCDLVDGAVLPLTVVCLRMPMISAFAGDIIVTREAQPGTLLVEASEWAYANEGDSDGDGVVFFVLKDTTLRTKVRLALEKSLLGKRGYVVAHGGYLLDHPYTDFYTEAKKKAVHGVVPKITKIDREKYIGAAGATATHYSFFMGRVFAMSSYLVFRVGADTARFGAADTDLQLACILAWRRLYEGLALSGYTPEAGEMARFLTGIATRNSVAVPVGAVPELRARGIDATITSSAGGDTAWVVGASAMAYAWYKCLNVDLTPGEAHNLYRALVATYSYGLIERKSGGEEAVDPLTILSEQGEHLATGENLVESVVYGMLRRGSKGVSVAAQLGAEDGNGLFRFMRPEYLTILGDQGILFEMAKHVWRVHTAVSSIRDSESEE